jgi:hypothetical protein
MNSTFCRQAPFDGAVGDQAPAIGQQHNLEHDARVVGAGTGLVVANRASRSDRFRFVVHQVIQRKLERAGLDLLTEHHVSVTVARSALRESIASRPA